MIWQTYSQTVQLLWVMAFRIKYKYKYCIIFTSLFFHSFPLPTMTTVTGRFACYLFHSSSATSRCRSSTKSSKHFGQRNGWPKRQALCTCPFVCWLDNCGRRRGKEMINVVGFCHFGLTCHFENLF
jgi:hypothetical protein